jgi:hypothetical protein
MYLLALCFSNGEASVDICGQPTVDSHVSMAYFNHDRSSVDRGNGTTDQENFHFDLQFELNDKLSVGAAHQYTILNVDAIEPQTNGHLHTIYLPLHRQIRSDRGSFRLSIAPALSASSNVVKDPGEYNGDALQLLAAVVWSRQSSERLSFRYGICSDHRFGRYAVYPSIGIDWQLHPDWTIDLGFPSSRLTYQVSNNLDSVLGIAPDGNEWHVMDSELQRQSRFVYESLLLEWVVNWKTQEHLVVTFGVGRQFHNRYEMTLIDDSRVHVRGDPVTRVGLALAWFF